MAAYDVIGLQSRRDAENLLTYLTHDAADTGTGRHHQVFGRQLKVKSYPIGIDAAGFREAANSEAANIAAHSSTVSLANANS